MSVEGVLPVASLPSVAGLHDKYKLLYQNRTRSQESQNKSTPRKDWQQAVPVDAITSALSGKATTNCHENSSVQSRKVDAKPSRNQLTKTTSFGGINAVSGSKVVLRRWTSQVSQEDKAKRHSTSVCEGEKKKNVFRPVSSILLSTPWEKDFKGKSKSRSEEKILERNYEVKDKKESVGVQTNNPKQSCLLKERIHEISGINSFEKESGLVGEKTHIEKSDHIDGEENLKTNNSDFEIEKNLLSRDYISLEQSQKKENNYSVKGETAIPALNNQPENHSCVSTTNETIVTDTLENSIEHCETMPLSSSNLYYRSKYDTGLDLGYSKRGNVPSSYPRRTGNLPTTSRAAPKIKELDQSVKDSVQEVDAYIQAYKSRRERSFEYGENSIFSNLSSRTDRKSSFDRSKEISHFGHASRSYASAGYSTQDSKISHDSTRQRSYLPRSTDKDYGYGTTSYSRPSNYSVTKSDRSKSFDTEPNYYQRALARTGSGGRYARQTVTSNSSSGSSTTSLSRKFSPAEPVTGLRTYTPRAPIDHSKTAENTSLKEVSSLHSERKLDPIKSQRSFDSPGDSSSRSRIMGGILSRFFQDDSPSIVSTSPSVTSEDHGSQATSHVSQSGHGQLVKVKSSFVGADTNVSSPEKEEHKVTETSPTMGAASSKDKTEAKPEQTTPQQKERRSSWIGRSLRKISSSSKASPVLSTQDESSEKPRRERRRSLLWRLGRESKTSESEELEHGHKATSSSDISDLNESKDRKTQEKGKSTEDKGKSTHEKVKSSEEKGKPVEEKEKEKGLSSYLRRSSKRRKSQSPEKEIAEARKVVSAESHEKDTAENKLLHNRDEQQSQSILPNHSDLKTESPVQEESFVIIEKPTELKSAPLAQIEHSDDEQDTNMSRITTTKDSSQGINTAKETTKFAEALRKKEQARKDAAAAKNETKTPSYLSSRFMKSRHVFENKTDKTSAGSTTSSSVALKDNRTSKIDQKRQAFLKQAPKSKTFDVVTPTKLTSFESKVSQSRGMDKKVDSKRDEAPVDEDNKQEGKSRKSQNEVPDHTKNVVRRLTSDSALSTKFSSVRSVFKTTTTKDQVKGGEVNRKSDYDQRKELKGLSEDNQLKQSEAKISEIETKKHENEEQTGGRLTNIDKKDAGLEQHETSLADDLKKADELVSGRKHEMAEIKEEAEEIKKDENESSDEPAAKPRDVSKEATENHLTATVLKDTLDEKQSDPERSGSRRRRERRSHRAKAVNPSDIQQIKDQMRADSISKEIENDDKVTADNDDIGEKSSKDEDRKKPDVLVNDVKVDKITDIPLRGVIEETRSKEERLQTGRSSSKDIDRDKTIDRTAASIIEEKKGVEEGLKTVESCEETTNRALSINVESKTKTTNTALTTSVSDDAQDGKLSKSHEGDKESKTKDADKIDIKLTNELGEESNESSGSSSGPKITTKSVIKEKIRQKKNTKHRAARAMSLPLGVNVVITPPTGDAKGYTVKEKLMNGQETAISSKPPINPPRPRSQEADDISTLKKKSKRPIRSRPKTLTQGIDPSLLLSDIKAKEEAVVVEETLSIVEIKQRLMRAETSGSRSPKTPDVQRKNKRRSGKRYKTITEGIAPGILEQAQQYASTDKDPHLLGVDHMNKLNLALSASTENLKRRSFIVSEVNSRVGSKGTSLRASMEDLSIKNDNDDNDKSTDSVVELSIKKLKKLPMALDSDEDEEKMPSVSSLKQRFLQAVEESYKAPKNKVTMRQKRGNKDRPFTISGIDDLTYKKIQIDINERRAGDGIVEEKEVKEKLNSEQNKKEEPAKKMDVLSENEIEEILEAEGLTADQLAAKLGINPSLSRGSPLRSRKPFLGSTTEESVVGVLEIIEEKPEKQQKQTAPLGNLREQFLSAMTEFKGGAADGKEEENDEEKKTKHRRVGVVLTTDLSKEENENHDDNPEEEQSDLDFISKTTTQLQNITDRRHLKPQRRQRTTANPVKTLQARNDLISEDESNKNAEDKKREPAVTKGLNALSQKSLGQQLWRKVALANEAKAALQGTEDFSKVKLKKVKEPGKLSSDGDENGGVKQSSITNILLQIKGRRHVQINIVDFSTSSLNNGDSFVIVTPKDLFCWHGRFANVIEKAKASEIASRINQKKEMGCKAFDVVYYEQDGQNEGRVFRTLGSSEKVEIKEDNIDDEDYEKNMMTSYMVYRLQDSDPPELVPVYEMCQRSPSKEILRTDEAFVLDFMSEVYVWIGRQTTSLLRKKIMKLAREKFDQGYYKPPTSAMTPHHHGKARKISLTASELPMRKQSLNRKMSVHKFLLDKENLTPRPSYSIFLSMFEAAEWVIFKEKFCDWPDESRIIRMKGGPQARGEVVKKVDVAEVKVVDPSTMTEVKIDPKLPIFEGTEIDRGQGKPKGSDGYHIITRNIQIWHVTEGSRTMLPETSHGHFHSGEGYVIRWEYTIVASRVMKMLKDMEEAKSTGRQRCAYFFWLGNDCAITEQGATAVMTVDLDEERGPHLRVLQGKEPPCFLNLFEGGMIVHAGKRQSQSPKSTFSDRSVVRFYCVRNEIPTEASLLQVPVSANSLRSRSSFILVLCEQAEIFLWHGCKSSDAIRETASNAAHRLIENHPDEAALSEKTEIFLTEIEEGHEPEVFWVALGGEDDYGSLLLDINIKWDFVPRCFHLTSATGVFVANEIINPSATPKEQCPFPFLQDDLYDAYQPAIFIIDAIHEVYLWLGWWPEDEENENSDAQRLRWDMLKRKAMESVVLYAKEAGRSLSHAYVVDAGLEPDQFTHLFPYWIVQEDITDIQLEDGREDSDRLQLITEKLEGFSREFYTVDELRQRPLPEGVNPSMLETYLSNEDFEDIFQISRDDFKKLPHWKQVNLKKRSGLY